MDYKDQVIARAWAWGHKDGGRVMNALEEVFSTEWSVGTNLQLKFYEQMIGTPYGAKDKCMDNVVDCAELARIGNYIFHGIDIGNFTDAQYASKLGKMVTENFADLPKCRPLDQPFYKTSALKKTGHTSIIFDAKRIIHSGASENGKRVDFSAITWGKKYWQKGMCVKRFLSDEQYASVIVGGNISAPAPEKWTCGRVLKLTSPRMTGRDVYDLEMALEALGYDCGMTKTEMSTKIGIFGPVCDNALRAWQKNNPECGTNGKPDGKGGKNTVTKLGGVWTGK